MPAAELFVLMGTCETLGDQHGADTAWLLSMWVAPEARRARVGSALVDLVVTWARSNGIARLVLDVADLNVAAVALYESRASDVTATSARYRRHASTSANINGNCF